jgi:chromosomal replication initiation ATPase DnaA
MATLSVGIAPPSDALCAALLAKHLADRQLRLAPDVAAFLLARLPREAAAIAHAVAVLDAASLEARATITRPFAAQALRTMLRQDDDTISEQPAASPGPADPG